MASLLSTPSYNTVEVKDKQGREGNIILKLTILLAQQQMFSLSRSTLGKNIGRVKTLS